MQNGTYQDFFDALRDFESGWDRARYESGRIADWQLNQWAGGTVNEFFPQYGSWGELTDAEWRSMSYTSTNSLGFVGYQFGEALLIDLGYYDDNLFFGNGAATNTWDGTWTGKNGIGSLDEFKTEAAQEVAIREAVGFNLKIIENGLSNQGESLADYLGTTRTYIDNGQEVTVTLTLTGIMAAAHLRGAFGTLNLLQNGSVSADEFGTSILRYIEQFGNYETPTIDEIIGYFESRVTGDEGLGTPAGSDTGGNSNSSNDANDGVNDGFGGSPTGASGGGTADISPSTATHVIDWNWGRTVVDKSFDPATDTIFIGWIGADAIEFTETAQGLVISVPSNQQTLTLYGVSLSDLNGSRIKALEASTREKIGSLIGTTDTTGGGTTNGENQGDTGGMGDTGHSDHGGMTGVMTTITLTSGNQRIEGFNAATDMVHIEAGITADRLQIFEESGDALGLTTRIAVADEAGQILSTTILIGVGLDDLSLANFSIAEQTALNEVTIAINAVITTPGGQTTGYTVVYDNDGSNPAASTGGSPNGGTKFRADVNADNIVGFDVTRDQIDVGGTSVHGMIITKTPKGELAIDSPWSNAIQVVQGVQFSDFTMDNFAIVGNEHFRQDIGGVMSWELGVGPRNSDTVYVRSHEYGVSETIDNFDPKSMKISFLYFGTRERLSVEDSDEGLRISSLPSGQTMILTDVRKADLVPGLIEFHHDQVIEDNLEVPFGFSAEQVTLVSRADILTPDGPAGASTDGLQTRTGDLTGASTGEAGGGSDGNSGGESGGDAGGSSGGDSGDNSGGASGGDGNGGSNAGGSAGIDGYDTFVFNDNVSDTAEITWNWAKKTAVTNFDTANDVIDLNSLMSGQVTVREDDGNLYVDVVGNGGNSTVFVGIQAEDLGRDNFTADSWNSVLSPNSEFAAQLINLGFEF